MRLSLVTIVGSPFLSYGDGQWEVFLKYIEIFNVHGKSTKFVNLLKFSVDGKFT